MKRVCLALLGALMFSPPVASAHDVPDVVRISVFLRPVNGRMLMLVRMPANAFIDFMFPMFEDGGLDLTIADSVAAEGAKVWIADILSLYEGGKALQAPHLLKVRISRMNDPLFSSFQDALRNVNGAPLPPDAFVTQDQAAVDALLEVPISSVNSSFSFEPRFGRLGVLVYTTLTFLPPTGGVRQFLYEGDPETFSLNPDARDAIKHFIQAGVAHYFSDTEYLLFVLCVALVFSRVRDLPSFAMTLAFSESLALIAALEWMPAAPLIPAACGILMAAATTYVGIEAIVAGEGKRMGLAIGAGLIFGCGLWRSLQPIVQFGGSHPIAAGLGFGAGVVMSELGTLVLAVAASKALLKLSHAPRAVVVVAAAVVIHISWRQMLDRVRGFSLTPGKISPDDLATFAAISVVAIAVAAGLASWLKRRNRVGITRAAM